MPPIILADTVRVEMRYQENSQERVNIFHLNVPGATTTDLSDIADLFDSHDDTFGDVLRNNTTTLTHIIVTNINDAIQEQFVKAITPPRPGTQTGGSMPGNVTSTVSWRTGFAGPRRRGRTYMVDTPVDQVTAGETISGTRAGLLATWGQTLINALQVASKLLVVASHTYHTWTPVLSVIVETILDSQRRRLPGRGR